MNNHHHIMNDSHQNNNLNSDGESIKDFVKDLSHLCTIVKEDL